MAAAPEASQVQVGSRRVRVSNLGKIYYPQAGFTKAHVLDYYLRVAKVLLPHLKDRPLTLKRYPEGVDGPHFYEKNCPAHRPGWVKTAPVYSEAKGAAIHFCLANDLATLVWAVNLADLELHTSLSLARDLQRPTVLALDLDPGPPAGLLECCQVALKLRQVLSGWSLQAFPKTSGSKGLQLYVPLNTPVTYAQSKPFARALAELLEREWPDRVVSNMKKSLRSGKVLIDWSQNDDKKTTVCAYSLRARPRPTVSTPLRWSEVERAVRHRSARHLVFEAGDVLRRIEAHGDLFAPVLSVRQRLHPHPP